MPKVMLAEDDTIMLSLLKTLLKLEGYDPIILDEQENVLDAIFREKPDCLLIDVHLTQGNGLDIVQKIRIDERIHNVFIIMQSGMNLQDECLTAGANVFLLKPYLPEVLIHELKSCIHI